MAALVTAESCGFPDHQFVDDDQFYGRGKSGSSGNGAGGLADASSGGGSVGVETGGAGGTTGKGGTGGMLGTGNRLGAGEDSGIIAVVPEGGRNRDTGGSAGTGAVGVDAGDSGADSAPGCDPGLDKCGSTCVDLQTDVAHCGDCTKACLPSQVCTSGKCSAPCAMGLTACTPPGGTLSCVDTTLDENNCAGCNNHCPPGTVCDGSTCLIDCGALSRCGAQCVDTATDDLHCGTCTTNCKAMGQVCSGSVCKTTCTAPYIACNNTCVNTQGNDDQNCGGCGKPCAAKQGCFSGVCKPLVENCLNGVDDDRDNLIDCADPDCTTGFTCGSVPAGWQGPFALWSGSPNGAPSCPSTYPAALFLAHDKLNVPKYSCPNCDCQPSSDATCGTLHFWYDTSSTCTASAAWDISVSPNGACVPEDLKLYSKLYNPASISIQSAQLTPPDQHSPSLPPYAEGTCTANQVAPSFPDATWGLDAEGCGAAAGGAIGGGCSVGQCMPKPATPFGGKLCIFKAGVTTCPSSYPNSSSSPQYYETWSDGRKCTSCSCGTVACGGTITAFTDLACTDNPTPVAIDGSCSPLTKDPTTTGFNQTKDDTLSIRWDDGGPVCGQGDSNAIGAAAPDSPITVCCQ